MSVVVFKCVLRRPNVRDGLVVLTTECLQPSADESTRWPAEMRAGAANHGKRHSKATCTSAYTPRVSLRLRTRRARPRPCPAMVVVGAGKTALSRFSKPTSKCASPGERAVGCSLSPKVFDWLQLGQTAPRLQGRPVAAAVSQHIQGWRKLHSRTEFQGPSVQL